MELDSDLQEIEAQSFQRAFFADGLLDLMLGAFLLLWAVEAFFQQAAFGGFGFVVLMPLYLVLRKKITIPRVGMVKFREQRQRQQKSKRSLMAGVLAFSAVAGLVIFSVISHKDEAPSETTIRLAPLPLGVVFAIMLTVAGFLYNVSRAFAYAMWIILSFTLTVFVNHLIAFDDASLALGLSALAPLVGGSLLLNQFLRRYQRA